MSHSPLFFFHLAHLAVIGSRDQQIIVITINTIFKTLFLDQKLRSDVRQIGEVCKGTKMEENSEQIMIPSYKEAFKIWLKIGLFSFGGPAGQIAMMHRTLVEEKKWIDEARFLHALNNMS